MKSHTNENWAMWELNGAKRQKKTILICLDYRGRLHGLSHRLLLYSVQGTYSE